MLEVVNTLPRRCQSRETVKAIASKSLSLVLQEISFNQAVDLFLYYYFLISREVLKVDPNLQMMCKLIKWLFQRDKIQNIKRG